MKHILITTAVFVAMTIPGRADAERIQADLTGFQEIPAVSTPAGGKFRAKITRKDLAINYELSYSGMQGDATQAHIHLAQKGVTGSIMLWLCQTASKPGPSASIPTCPTRSGTVTGKLTASDVLASQATQQIAAGELDEAVAAIRGGVAYVNVHTTASASGELRGQIRPRNKVR
jgi:hypothetical protein